MKVLLINPEAQSIGAIDISNLDDIIKLIGFDTAIADEIGPDGDCLFFDEDCFLRGTDGRFQIDSVIPVSGKGVIVGSNDEGVTLKDVVSSIASIQSRIKYL